MGDALREQIEKQALVKKEQEVEVFDVLPLQILGKAVEEAERKIELVDKIKKIALKVTSSADWIDEGGKPYLLSSGAEKIARLFGISWRIDEPQKEVLEDGHIVFTYKGYFTMGTITIEAIGVRSTKDPFFRFKKDKAGNRIVLPPSDVDIGAVKKAAYTNCIMNGITRLLGIRNLTWEDLEAHGIVRKDKVAKVDFKKKKTEQSQERQEDTSSQTKETPEETHIITAGIVDIATKKGTDKNGKQWTLHVITVSDLTQELQLKTFSETLLKQCIELRKKGEMAEFVYKKTKYGNELVEIKGIETQEEVQEKAPEQQKETTE